MAIIYDGIECAICGEKIDVELLNADEFVATTHFIDDPFSPLWQFSDAAMHKPCFHSWPLRQQFVDPYNLKMRDVKCQRNLHTQMNEDGEVVRVNEDEVVPENFKADEEFVDSFLSAIVASKPRSKHRNQ